MLKGRNLIEPFDFSTEELTRIFDLADEIIRRPEDWLDSCRGKLLATLFYEPSTRTQMSFQTAMLRLGGKLIGFDNPGNSSVSKGESLKDTIRVISNYADIIVIRNSFEGAAMAASIAANSELCPRRPAAAFFPVW